MHLVQIALDGLRIFEVILAHALILFAVSAVLPPHANNLESTSACAPEGASILKSLIC